MTALPAWTVALHDDPDAFADRALPFLLRREAENCLPIGLLGSYQVRDGGAYLATIERAGGEAVAPSGELVGVSMMTPPFNLILASGTDPATLPAVLEHVAGSGFPVPGVVGPSALSGAFARLWSERFGTPARLDLAQRIYELRAVTPVTGVPGVFREAREADRPLLVDWAHAFTAEALGPADRARAEDLVAHAFVPSAEERRIYVWEVDGRPVSMAGTAGRTLNGIRVQSVYTPPALRGRGYASACVAALSQAQLDAGRSACFIFTNLANPTSNHIYQAIGYEPVADADLYVFEPAG